MSDQDQTVEAAVEAVPMETPATQIDPVEEAAMRFTHLLPYVKKFANATPSKGALVRVMAALAEFPLGKTMPRLLTENERQLFQVMQELNSYKTTILTSIIKNKVPNQEEQGSTNESEQSEE